MDAVSLGFMRYDNPIKAATNNEKKNNETQNEGSGQ